MYFTVFNSKFKHRITNKVNIFRFVARSNLCNTLQYFVISDCIPYLFANSPPDHICTTSFQIFLFQPAYFILPFYFLSICRFVPRAHLCKTLLYFLISLCIFRVPLFTSQAAWPPSCNPLLLSLRRSDAASSSPQPSGQLHTLQRLQNHILQPLQPMQSQLQCNYTPSCNFPQHELTMQPRGAEKTAAFLQVRG